MNILNKVKKPIVRWRMRYQTGNTNMDIEKVKKVCLIVIDGWGINTNAQDPGDAIRLAKHPVVDDLLANHSHTELNAHGMDVGLPDKLMGNSEVGHLNIGAGRIVMQDIVRINKVVAADTISNLNSFISAVKHVSNTGGRLHLLGLVSDGGVHSHIRHLYSLLESAKKKDVPTCYIHYIADGRDTPPKSTIKYFLELSNFLQTTGYGKIATIMGRYYAMDRDKRWERTKIAYEAYLNESGQYTTNPVELIENTRYVNNETDEFLKPILLDKEGVIRDGDAVITFNYRSDRMRQITSVFSGLIPPPFESSFKLPSNLYLVTMTQYDEKISLPVLFPPQCMDNVLAEYLSSKNLKQVHIAETEKYAHVTFFFNGGREICFDNEDRILVPSPKVSTYDLKPEMSVEEVARKVSDMVSRGDHHFVMCNLAPPDMIGHTGKLAATVKAVEFTDKAIGIIKDACSSHNYNLFITSDHGNAEKMLTDDGTPVTSHTCNKVFFISLDNIPLKKDGGSLCDVAPTIIDYMGLTKPKEMLGSSLIGK